jgi:hypothetical protein
MGGGRSTMRAESSAVMLIVSFGYTLTEQRSSRQWKDSSAGKAFAASFPLHTCSFHTPT